MALIPYEVNDPIAWHNNTADDKPDKYTPCVLQLFTQAPKEIGYGLYFWHADLERWYPAGISHLDETEAYYSGYAGNPVVIIKAGTS
jgi:hypothetical protein